VAAGHHLGDPPATTGPGGGGHRRRRLLGCRGFQPNTIDAVRLFRGRFVGDGPGP
jgi:hypothetical protein